MNVLFVHQNFPGQFKHLAPALLARGDRVAALCMSKFAGAPGFEGLRLVKATAARSSAKDVHPWVSDFETKVIRAEATFHAAVKLRDSGFAPDVIVAHPGWGESLFLKEVWPEARIGIYCEFFYQTHGGDNNFDPEFPPSSPQTDPCRLLLKNCNNYLHFHLADAGVSPTEWQASTFPKPFRDRITVVHDGIDTNTIRPNPNVAMSLKSGPRLTRQNEVITFVNRNLEPYRGYHVFMRALPELLRRRPNAHVMIVGGNGVSYGARPPQGKTWRQIFQQEVQAGLDLSRVHFLGHVPYSQFLALLQLSSVHVYLTYPFVLSWSLLEAMSAGCAVVASDTQPLREAVRHGETGRLVNFFDQGALVQEVCTLLDDPAERERLGANARAFAQRHYDLRTVCLPRQLAWIDALASHSK